MISFPGSPSPFGSRCLALCLVLVAWSAPSAAQVNVPSWLDESMGYTLHTVAYYNSSDQRSPMYYHPLKEPFLTFPGHAERLADALAQKSRRFGAGLVRLHVPLTTLQPLPADYSGVPFVWNVIERFQRQGIGVVLQLDAPPSFLSPVATDSFANTAANQGIQTAFANVAPDTDLALYDQLWDGLFAKAQMLDTALKPAGEIRIVPSGRNEPRGRYAPAQHPLSIALRGSAGEWARMAGRLRFNDLQDGSRDLIIGSIETLGTNGADQVDAYTIHDYASIGFGNNNQINIISETGGFLPYQRADAALKYIGVQRGFVAPWGLYVAHLADDLDLGARLSGGSPRGLPGKVWSDTQVRNSSHLNLDTWDEPVSGGVGSRVADLVNVHPWLTARASNTLVQDDYDLVITHNATPFYRPGRHPDSGSGRSGSYGFELPSDQFGFDLYVRNLGRLACNVEMSVPRHNYRSLTMTPSTFSLGPNGVQRVRVDFDCGNDVREGFHAAELRASIVETQGQVYDRIPLAVLSDLDRDSVNNEPLIATGQLQYSVTESTQDLSQYTEGSQVAVYRAPVGKAFSVSHLRVHIGGSGPSNYNANIVVDAWDEALGDWDPRHAFVLRCDGNIQNGNAFAQTMLPQGAPANVSFVRLDWPMPHWSIPLLSYSAGLDGKGPLTALRVRIVSLDAAGFPETFAKQAGLEITGKLFDRVDSVHLTEDFAQTPSGFTSPGGAFRVDQGAGVLEGQDIVRTTYANALYEHGLVSSDVRLEGASFAGLRVFLREVDDLPWGPRPSGYMARLSSPGAGQVRILLQRAGAPLTTLAQVDVAADPQATHRLALRFERRASANAFEVFLNGMSRIVHVDRSPTALIAGTCGLVAYTSAGTGRARFDNFEINPAPQVSAHPGPGTHTYVSGTPYVFHVSDRDQNGLSDLDFLVPPELGGVGLAVSFDWMGNPQVPLFVTLPWWALVDWFRIDPADFSLTLELEPVVLPGARLLSARTPVTFAWQAIDRAGLRSALIASFR